MLNLGSALFSRVWGQGDRQSKRGFKLFDLTLEFLCTSIEVHTFRLRFLIFTGGGHLVFGASL